MENVADREELLVLLSEAARKGRVGAMRILLTELQRDTGSEPAPPEPFSSVIDEITKRRRG
jgi:hypothetical protein